MNKRKIAIIGAGPAGIACAVQLARYGLSPIIFEKSQAGGLLWNANLVENYMGFPKGISGRALSGLFKEQLLSHSIEIIKQEVLNIEYKNEFIIELENNKYYSEYMVLASGTIPKRADNIKIEKNAKTKIFYEVKDLYKIREKEVIIYGAGDAAFDYAINLSKNNDITILNRSDKLKCLDLLWERSSKINKIKYFNNSKIEKVLLKKDKLLVNCIDSELQKQLFADYLLFAIGRKANDIFFAESLKEKISELEKKQKLFQIGDLKNGIYRQAAISTGDGIKTAMILQELVK